MIRTLAYICLVMLFSINISLAESSQQPKVISSEKRALIIEYFTLLKADVFTPKVLQQQMAQLKKNGLKLDASVEQEFIEQLSNMNALLKIYGPVYAKHLTDKELSSTLSFFKSDLGQRVLAHELKGKKPDASSFSAKELRHIKAFEQSQEWKAIEAKMPAISKDAIIVSNYYVTQFIKYAKQKYPSKVDLSKISNNQ